MAHRIEELRRRLDQLREPARSVALEQLHRLETEGRPERDALEAALGAAEEWESSRASNTAGRQNPSPR